MRFNRLKRQTLAFLCAALCVSAVAEPAAIKSLQIEIPGQTESLSLRGKDARRQLLITGKDEKGAQADLTHKAKIDTSPAGIIEIKDGLVLPLKNGETTITASFGDETKAELKATVTDFEKSVPINFANQIVPIFTKAGCNAGGCHGKSSGQNGFKLSLLGFEAGEDYDYLVKEARGRRLFPAAPERSLLLLKGTATLPHGGGKKTGTEFR